MSSHKWKLWKYYEVHWDDIVTDQGWVGPDGEKLRVAKCVSHGYLTEYIPGKRGQVRLSATRGDNLDGSDLQYNQHIAIPIGCITLVKPKENPGD